MYFQQPFHYQEQPQVREMPFQPQSPNGFMNIPPGFMPMENPQIKQDDKSVELIEEAARREKKMAFYDEKIMESFRDELEKRRIRQIFLNQKKHDKMFGEIYQGMTGRKLSFDIKEPNLHDNLEINLDQRIFQGFECIELYRKIYFSVMPVEWKQMMYEIIGDEQNDILKYLYYCQKK